MQTVVGLAGTLVRLAGYDGQASAVQLAHLLASEDFEIVGGSGQKRPPVSGSALAGLREDVAKDALRWERHIVEVFTGVDPDAEPGTEPRPQYDPAVYSLAQREEAKAAELAAAGEQVTARTVKRKRQRYETQGLAGLVDWRADRSTPARGRIDERVVDALQQAVNEKSASSTRTASFYLWRTREILARKYGPDTVPMPARATFYRLFERVTAGQHTTGSARTRQSLANRPDRPFRQLTAGRPGEIMEIDSTPLDVMVMLDNGLPGRVELTGMVDLATRTVTAAVLRPTTKSVDASLLLARTVTPEPMQPGWAEALSMTRSVLPHQRLLTLDQRLQHAAARPVMVPETIGCERPARTPPAGAPAQVAFLRTPLRTSRFCEIVLRDLLELLSGPLTGIYDPKGWARCCSRSWPWPPSSTASTSATRRWRASRPRPPRVTTAAARRSSTTTC
jgi:hypothetical protein